MLQVSWWRFPRTRDWTKRRRDLRSLAPPRETVEAAKSFVCSMQAWLTLNTRTISSMVVEKPPVARRTLQRTPPGWRRKPAKAIASDETLLRWRKENWGRAPYQTGLMEESAITDTIQTSSQKLSFPACAWEGRHVGSDEMLLKEGSINDVLQMFPLSTVSCDPLIHPQGCLNRQRSYYHQGWLQLQIKGHFLLLSSVFNRRRVTCQQVWKEQHLSKSPT